MRFFVVESLVLILGLTCFGTSTEGLGVIVLSGGQHYDLYSLYSTH